MNKFNFQNWPSRIIWLAVIVILFSAAACNRVNQTSNVTSPSPTVILPGGQRIKVIAIADSAEEQAQGLSGRTSLGQNEGIWFIFDEEGYYPFWMPEMNFSLDIIWLDKDYRVADIARNVSPLPPLELNPPRYTNQRLAKYVLEVNAGVGSGLAIGDRLTLMPGI